MIIDKSFTCTDNEDAMVEVGGLVPDEVYLQYPNAAKCFATNLIAALAQLGVTMTYNEQTYEARINDVSFTLIYGPEFLSLVGNGGNTLIDCAITQANVFLQNSITQEMCICVKGTENTFEVTVGIEDLFGIYAFEKVSDGKKFTALRKNTTEGIFWIFENGKFVETAEVIIPSNGPHSSSKFSAAGVALIPAVSTSFVYRILDAFLYIPFLHTGTYYNIADFSVVAVASCVLINY